MSDMPKEIWAWQNYGKFWSAFKRSDMKPRENAEKYTRENIETVTRQKFIDGCGHILSAQSAELMAKYIEQYFPDGLKIGKE